MKQDLPFEIYTSPSKGRLSLDPGYFAKMDKEISIEAEMLHTLATNQSKKSLGYSSNFLPDMQKSKKKRHRGLSLRNFANEKEMDGHVGRIFEGPESRQAQFCSICPTGK